MFNTKIYKAKNAEIKPKKMVIINYVDLNHAYKDM